MGLYKYTSADNGLKILQNSQIRFTQPSAFNDPFDVFPCMEDLISKNQISGWINKLLNDKEAIMNDVFSSAKEVYNTANEDERKGMTFEKFENIANLMVNKNWDLLLSYMFHPNTIDRFKETMTLKILEAIGMAFGIFCLSKKNDDLLMWSHYADSHRGIVLEFDETHPYFNTMDLKKGYLSGNVEYAINRPSLSMDNMQIQNSAEIVRDVFYIKSDIWRYEKEYRVIRKLADSIPVTENCGEYPIHLFDFPPETIKTVIFGCRIDDKRKDDIIKLLNERPEYNNVTLKQAKADRRLYQLDILIEKR